MGKRRGGGRESDTVKFFYSILSGDWAQKSNFLRTEKPRKVLSILESPPSLSARIRKATNVTKEHNHVRNFPRGARVSIFYP